MRWSEYKQFFPPMFTEALCISAGVLGLFHFWKSSCRDSPLPAPVRTGSLLNILLLPSCLQNSQSRAINASAGPPERWGGGPLSLLVPIQHPHMNHTCLSCDSLLIAPQRGKNNLARRQTLSRRPKARAETATWQEGEEAASLSPHRKNSQALPKVTFNSWGGIFCFTRQEMRPSTRLLQQSTISFFKCSSHFERVNKLTKQNTSTKKGLRTLQPSERIILYKDFLIS